MAIEATEAKAGEFSAGPVRQALLLQLPLLASFRFVDTFTKRLFTLSQCFRKLRQPRGAEKQKDHEHDDYKLWGTESPDSQDCLIHDFLFLGAAPGWGQTTLAKLFSIA